jgi:hypothetical protein
LFFFIKQQANRDRHFENHSRGGRGRGGWYPNYNSQVFIFLILFNILSKLQKLEILIIKLVHYQSYCNFERVIKV